MDHMRISGTEPSSMLRSKREFYKRLKSDVPKMPKQTEAKRNGVINPQNLQFQSILNIEHFYDLKRYESTN